MAFLTWNDDYLVGVRSLDNQHSVLFNLLNELHAAMLNGQARNRAVLILRNLLNYTRGHFSTEEAMMASAGYPGLDRHRIQHRGLTKHVQEFEARFERGEGALNPQLFGFLRDWLTNHIQDADKEYGLWLNQKGVQ
ncbi:MAG TPA: bacteriohemerythrin [Terracidiphilus sp.]|jgi:hemerythrin-like metal-binding protein